MCAPSRGAPCGRPHLVQLLACLLLHAPDVLHGQLDPLVDPAEELAVEVGEQALLLLRVAGDDTENSDMYVTEKQVKNKEEGNSF